ncbi:MAG: hypothetical protein ACM3PY_00365, partial [Omnitrophica WOR_2 bacterium]
MEKEVDHNFPVDIDWMPQSSRVSDADLIDVLMREIYPGLFQQACAFTLDAKWAKKTAREVIIWSVLNRHRYWGETSLRSW